MDTNNTPLDRLNESIKEYIDARKTDFSLFIECHTKVMEYDNNITEINVTVNKVVEISISVKDNKAISANVLPKKIDEQIDILDYHEETIKTIRRHQLIIRTYAQILDMSDTLAQNIVKFYWDYLAETARQ